MSVIATIAAGLGSSLINAMSGRARDSVQFQRQKELNEINNKFNAQEAQKQRAAAMALQRNQQQYNSEVAQVTRLKEAGLNPALLYGGATSSAGVTSASSASASPSSYSPSGNQLDLDLAGNIAAGSDIELQRAQIENTRMNTASQGEDVTQKSINNRYIETKTNIELLKMLQEYENLKKSGALTDKDLAWYDKTKSAMLEQISAQMDFWSKQGLQYLTQSDKNIAEKNFIEGAQTKNVNADTVLKGSQTSLNNAKKETETTIQNLNKENITSQQVHQALEKMQTSVAEITEKELQRKYDLDNAETQGFYRFCDKYGIPRAFSKGLLNLYGEFVKGTGQGLSQFFSGNNWFDFYNQFQNRENATQINDARIKSEERNTDERIKSDNRNSDRTADETRYRTDKWSRKDREDVPKASSSPSKSDAVQTTPSVKTFNQYLQTLRLDDNDRRMLLEILNDKYPTWTKELQAEFRKELYYSNSVVSTIYKYYYKH